MKIIKDIVAIAHFNPLALDLHANLRAIETLIKEAKNVHKKFLILPCNALLGEDANNVFDLFDLQTKLKKCLLQLQNILQDAKDLNIITAIANAGTKLYYVVNSSQILTFNVGNSAKFTDLSIAFESNDADLCIVCDNIYFQDEDYLKTRLQAYQSLYKNCILVSLAGLANAQYIYTGLACIIVEHKIEYLAKPFNAKTYALLDLEKSFYQSFLALDEYALILQAIGFALFDYWRKTKANGFALSLSGGADSALCACSVVYGIANAIADLELEGFCEEINIKQDIPSNLPLNKLICQYIVPNALATLYQGSDNSTSITQEAALAVASSLGSNHHSVNISSLVKGYTDMINATRSEDLSWDKHDITLQNIQARVRGPSIWMLANSDNKLLLATSNLSEVTVGYCTMDGDTVGGIAPIAGIFKSKVLKINAYLESHGIPCSDGSIIDLSKLQAVNKQAPTAELRPGGTQTDESDLMPYVLLDELASAFYKGKLEELLKSKASCDKELYYTNAKKMLKLYARSQWKRLRYAQGFMISAYTQTPLLPVLTDAFTSIMQDY